MCIGENRERITRQRRLREHIHLNKFVRAAQHKNYLSAEKVVGSMKYRSI